MFSEGAKKKVEKSEQRQRQNWCFQLGCQHLVSSVPTADNTGWQQGWRPSCPSMGPLMRASHRGCRHGTEWGIRERLKDLDFADDLCLLAQKFIDL